MTPQQAGALLNTADLAYRSAKEGATVARRYGLEVGPCARPWPTHARLESWRRGGWCERQLDQVLVGVTPS